MRSENDHVNERIDIMPDRKLSNSEKSHRGDQNELE